MPATRSKIARPLPIRLATGERLVDYATAARLLGTTKKGLRANWLRAGWLNPTPNTQGRRRFLFVADVDRAKAARARVAGSRQLFSLAEAARYLRISPAQVARYRSAGQLRADVSPELAQRQAEVVRCLRLGQQVDRSNPGALPRDALDVVEVQEASDALSVGRRAQPTPPDHVLLERPDRQAQAPRGLFVGDEHVAVGEAEPFGSGAVVLGGHRHHGLWGRRGPRTRRTEHSRCGSRHPACQAEFS
jgi:hypothetical protein